jgi:hypothetical protein
MIDPEVARLRRLRSEALLVREIARTFESTQWAANESLLDRSACASWRISRVVSGRLRGHPYAEYQKDASAASRAANRLQAFCLALINTNRLSALKVLETHVAALARQLEDAISLAWSSDFSDALGRSQFEIKSLSAALTAETRSGGAEERQALRPARSAEGVVGEIGAALEGDWPYLAF